jgi:hypothetical protein
MIAEKASDVILEDARKVGVAGGAGAAGAVGLH